MLVRPKLVAVFIPVVVALLAACGQAPPAASPTEMPTAAPTTAATETPAAPAVPSDVASLADAPTTTPEIVPKPPEVPTPAPTATVIPTLAVPQWLPTATAGKTPIPEPAAKTTNDESAPLFTGMIRTYTSSEEGTGHLEYDDNIAETKASAINWTTSPVLRDGVIIASGIVDDGYRLASPLIDRKVAFALYWQDGGTDLEITMIAFDIVAVRVNILPATLTPWVEEHGGTTGHPIPRENVIAIDYSVSEDGSFSIEASSRCPNECVIGVWGYDKDGELTLLDALRLDR